MAFDSSILAAVVAELQVLVGGRINRVYQPTPEEISLSVYAGGTNLRLLISAHPKNARLHLSEIERVNPPSPPLFCMTLRKHLEGGRILRVEQEGLERIAKIVVSVIDELGNPVQRLLVAEIMGKHSNVILLEGTGRIIDSIKRVTSAVSRHREVLPGRLYVPPPEQDRLEPDEITIGKLAERLAHELSETAVSEFLIGTVAGLGPLMARELEFRAGLAGRNVAHLVQSDTAHLASLIEVIQAWATDLRNRAFVPTLLLDKSERVQDFAAFPVRHWPGPFRTSPTTGALLDFFFDERERQERIEQTRGNLIRVVSSELERCRKKLALQEESLAESGKAEEYRLMGELLTANLYQVSRGQDRITVVNYYDPDGGTLEIPLDPKRSPSENAQRFYRKYAKAKSTLEQAGEQRTKTLEEIDYLEQVEASLEQAVSLPDLEEIRRELAASGYIKETGRRPAEAHATKTQASPPLTLRTSDGLEVWVGRNNRQNDYLTLKLAGPADLWFHTREIPGSHVILRVPPGARVPETSILEAALLAAYFSKARHSSQVPVDFTQRKHVRKPSGAKPGMVIYDSQRTVYVTPSEPEVKALLARPEGVI